MGKRRASTKRSRKKTVSTVDILTRSIPKRSNYSETCSEKGKLRRRRPSPMKILKPGKEESTTKTTGTKTSTAYTENKPLTNKELLDDFSDSLQTIRLEIAEDIRAFLSRTETNLHQHLAETICLHANDLLFSQHEETAILTPLDVESPPAVDSTDFREERSLGSLVADMHRSLHVYGSDIRGLWEEWSKVQQKIVCLGLEVLGSSRFNSIKPNSQKTFRRRLQAATTSNENLEGHKAELYNLIHGETDKIKNITQKAVGRSKAQAKAWRAEKRRYWEAMGDLAQKLAARS